MFERGCELCDYAGCGEGATDSREGEVVHGVEGYSPAPTWARGGRTTPDIPTDSQGENQADEGGLHISESDL